MEIQFLLFHGISRWCETGLDSNTFESFNHAKFQFARGTLESEVYEDVIHMQTERVFISRQVENIFISIFDEIQIYVMANYQAKEIANMMFLAREAET